MASPAVFVIDMINDSFGHAELDRMRGALCSSINELTEFARSKGFPVIWVRQEFEPDLSDAFLDMKRDQIRMYVRGTRGAQIVDELKRDHADIEIVKKRYSMFYGTRLDLLLQDLKPGSLILAGVNTHACIRTAAIDAFQRDYQVVVVRDCVASKDREHHDVTLNYLNRAIARVVSLKELERELRISN